jgi:hypothetical protein
MKIVIINNTFFGYKGKGEEQLLYFNNIFIPLIKKHLTPNDMVVHLGNVFNNKNIINVSLLKNVYTLFGEISSWCNFYIINNTNDTDILHVFKDIRNLNVVNNFKLDDIYITNQHVENNSKYYLSSYDYKTRDIRNKFVFNGYYNIEQDDNIINVLSPYSININNNNNGIYLVDTKTINISFIKNDYSPKYLEIEINDSDELKSLENYKKDYIFLKIKKEILNKKGVNEFISNYNILNIDTFDENNNLVDNITDITNIQTVLKDYVIQNEPLLLKDLERIFKLKKPV